MRQRAWAVRPLLVGQHANEEKSNRSGTDFRRGTDSAEAPTHGTRTSEGDAKASALGRSHASEIPTSAA